MPGILDQLGSVNTTVAIDQTSINNMAKMLVLVVAIGLMFWVIAKKLANK